jgi:replicative DNA helicase
LPRSDKISNLVVAMADVKPPISEAEDLDSFLAGLQSGGAVREITGWESGFPALTRALNGISPGLYLLVGPPGCGKSAFAKQLVDQVARRNSVPAVFFTFTEKKTDLRIRTLARLSGLETREIRRGAGYLLHTYGVSKHGSADPNEMSPGWEKLKLVAAEAKSWLDLIYIEECDQRTTLNDIEQRVREVRELKKSESLMAVIDDSQRLGDANSSFEARLPLIAESLQAMAMRLDLPILATWPDLHPADASQHWAERTAGANVVMVMREDAERKPPSGSQHAIALHVVKNRGGEKAVLHFDFSPASAKFIEAAD